MEERVVEMWEERECLYNIEIKEYADRILKDRALREIAAAVDVSGG